MRFNTTISCLIIRNTLSYKQRYSLISIIRTRIKILDFHVGGYNVIYKEMPIYTAAPSFTTGYVQYTKFESTAGE